MSQLGVGDLLVRSFALYRRNWRRVVAMTLPIVIVVTGVTALGLGELGARFHTSASVRDVYVELGANFLVTVPLVNSLLARWVLVETRGEHVSSTDLVVHALESFPQVLLVVVMWLAGLFVGVFLIVLWIFILVSWYFGVQAVVIDGCRGPAAIARSAGLVRGNWMRTAATGLAFLLIVLLPGQFITGIFESLASSANSYALVVAGQVVANTLTLPFLAIGSTLYYLQLRAAAGGA